MTEREELATLLEDFERDYNYPDVRHPTVDAQKDILDRYVSKIIELCQPYLDQQVEAESRGERKGMNEPGNCETCRFISWDGELGTIQCCDNEKFDYSDDEHIYTNDEEEYLEGQCPLWDAI